jgi:hypothetical protein
MRDVFFLGDGAWAPFVGGGVVNEVLDQVVVIGVVNANFLIAVRLSYTSKLRSNLLMGIQDARRQQPKRCLSSQVFQF